MSGMAIAPEQPTAIVRSMRFDDMDAMAHALVSNILDFVPLRSGPFHGRFCEIDLGGFMLRRIFHAPLLMHGEVPPDLVALHLVRSAGGATLNGDVVGSSDLAVLPAGAAIQAICPAEQDRIGIVFRAEAFERLIDECGVQPFPRGSHRLLRLRENQAGTLVRAFAAMTDLAESLPDLFAVPGLDHAMSDECQRLLAGVLSGEEDHPECSRQTADMLRWVAAADGFLREHIDRPVYTDELCAALHVSARALHQSFAAVYGMSPHGYLRRRRLVLVRRALRSARDGPALVKSVALAHGFWHLGRFARDYAAMFREMPSDTVGKDHHRTDSVMA
jgi:AraC family transcriptional regulator, ethanolamine operon transcriptional activator